MLILADDDVTDVKSTMDSLKVSSDASLSIVIIGIGTADFTLMESLEYKEEKDISQFVKFNSLK